MINVLYCVEKSTPKIIQKSFYEKITHSNIPDCFSFDASEQRHHCLMIDQLADSKTFP